MSTAARIKQAVLPAVIRIARVFHRVWGEYAILRAYGTDMFRYMRHSFRMGTVDHSYEKISAAMILYAHSIEKGMTLPDVRPGYGERNIRQCVDLLRRYNQHGYPPDGLPTRKARAVLTEYLKYHEDIGFDLGALRGLIEPFVQEDCAAGGYLRKDRAHLQQEARSDFASCALSRYSIRDYSQEEIAIHTLREAVAIARKTPSVCNRQPWHLYIVKDAGLKTRILELQGGGSRGFGHRADCLLVVTTDIQAFVGAHERNEAYVDGGLFAMSLMYALHYKGLGVCPLNWMVLPEKDARLRTLLGMPRSYNIVMLLAVGHLPEHVRVAKSVRHEVDSLITVR